MKQKYYFEYQNDNIIARLPIVEDTEKLLPNVVEIELEENNDMIENFIKYKKDGTLIPKEEFNQLYPNFYNSDENEKEKQEATLEQMMYVSARASFLMELPDSEASNIPLCFDAYTDDPDGFPYEKDMRREYKGQLYKCLQWYKKEKDNPTQNPDVAVSLWVLAYNEEWPQWKQPTGSYDAYNTGDKVSHNDHKYTSNIDGNTTEPGSDERWWTLVE